MVRKVVQHLHGLDREARIRMNLLQDLEDVGREARPLGARSLPVARHRVCREVASGVIDWCDRSEARRRMARKKAPITSAKSVFQEERGTYRKVGPELTFCRSLARSFALSLFRVFVVGCFSLSLLLLLACLLARLLLCFGARRSVRGVVERDSQTNRQTNTRGQITRREGVVFIDTISLSQLSLSIQHDDDRDNNTNLLAPVYLSTL